MSVPTSLPAFRALSPATIEGLQRINEGVKQSGIDAALIELVKLRVSQINGCAFCLSVHLKEAERLEIDSRRLHLLAAWREANLYSERERAALAWAEALTRVAVAGLPESLVEQMREHFTETELAQLTAAVVAINGFNRIALAYRFPVGAP